MNERFIAVDKTMATSQDVAFKPSFNGVLAQHLHDPAVRRQLTAVRVFREVLTEPCFLTHFIDGIQLVGLSFIRPDHTEILHVVTHNFSNEVTECRHVAGQGLTGLVYFDCEVAKVRNVQRLSYQTAIGNWVRTHSPRSLWGQVL